MDGSLKIIERLQTELTTATDTISRLTRELEKLRETTNWACEKCGNPRSSAPCVHCELAEAKEKGELLCSAHGAALIEISRITKELDHESGLLAVARKWVEKWQKEDPMVKDLLELRRAIAKRKAGE